jgi:type IV pilus assembly protein PilN
MRRVNLLPPEERRGPAERLRGDAPAVLLIVGAVALIAMVGVYLYFFVRLNGVEDEIAALDQQIAQQNQRLAELAPYRDLQARLEAKKPVADGIFRTRFPWDEFLQGLAFVIPETTALDTLTAEAAPIDIQAPAEQPLEPSGAVTFTGVALPQYQNVSDFIVQLNNLRYLSNAELNSAELDRETFTQPAINFEVASELITIVGENGTEVRLEGGLPTEVADTRLRAER